MPINLIRKAADLFQVQDSWTSLLELRTFVPSIVETWKEKLGTTLMMELRKEQDDKVWAYQHDELWSENFYLHEFGPQSICLWIEMGKGVSLWGKPETMDISKARGLLSKPLYRPLLDCFHYPQQTCGEDGGYLVKESIQAGFQDVQNDTPEDEWSWYAGYMTPEFVKHILTVIDNFRAPKATDLLRRLNNEAKR